MKFVEETSKWTLFGRDGQPMKVMSMDKKRSISVNLFFVNVEVTLREFIFLCIGIGMGLLYKLWVII